MDPITLGFYAVVCGILSATVPEGLQRWARFALGAVVGLVAAGILPVIKGFLY